MLQNNVIFVPRNHSWQGKRAWCKFLRPYKFLTFQKTTSFCSLRGYKPDIVLARLQNVYLTELICTEMNKSIIKITSTVHSLTAIRVKQ